ncbi:hypothetical protein MTR_1g059560 [Medicago truncatula]|uniref:F-box domain-containing protein n=1 Tax=Medicago truncatula TaxID=3880 RepID=A0A072VKP1_MEDTR|nr:hypothetical protein MTR_1g059560 [Medicago truncatula]
MQLRCICKSWNSLISNDPDFAREGIIVGGTVNWFANSNVNTCRQAIVSLHLGKESYQDISQPDYGMPSNLTLGIMKDCLCVFSSSLGLYCQDPKMVYISVDDNNVLLLFREFSILKWVVYDRKYHTTRTIKIEDFSWVDSKLYVESLVSP